MTADLDPLAGPAPMIILPLARTLHTNQVITAEVTITESVAKMRY